MVLDGKDEVSDQEAYKAGLDTILDITKNPERQK